MSPELLTSMRELNSRQSNGVLVRLLWCQDDDRVFVAVNDHRTGEAFSVEVPAGEPPLQVFDHPYVYGEPQRAEVDVGAHVRVRASTGGRI